MNFQELTAKLRMIEEGTGNVQAAMIGAATPELDDGMGEGHKKPLPVAPTKDDGPGQEEGLIIGAPMPGMMGHPEQPKQQDNVTMSVSMNGSGAGGIADLMKILRNIEDGENKDPHQHDVSKLFGEPHAVDHEEPIMGDIVAKLAHEETDGQDSPMTHEYEIGEQMDDEEEWANSANGSSGHHTHGIEAVTFSGDDMNSKGKSSPLQRVPGSNTLREPTNVSETLVDRLSAMYQAIKEERTETKNEKGEVVSWRDESDWRPVKKGADHTKSARGKVTNMSDKARRESEKIAKKDVKENAHHDDDEEKKIRHLMQKYGWSRQEALEYFHYEKHDPKDYEDMEESAKWRDPKYKGQLFTQKKGDSDDYDSIDYGYGIKERPKKDPGQKRSTFDRDTVWTDPLDTRSNLPKHHNDPENWGYGSISSKGDSKGKLTADRRKRMKNDIRGSLGQHHTPTLPEQMNESKELNDIIALTKMLKG